MIGMMRRALAWLVLLAMAVCGQAGMAGAPRAPLVLAAASLQESLSEAADRWAATGHPRPVISFAASSTLARQITAGAPADLFVSADEPWMDDLARRGLIVPATRVAFLGNALVLVAPAASRARVDMRNPAKLAALINGGALAMADIDSVPAGKYGKAALGALGIWERVQGHVVRADNVRGALALVERGAAPLGIVYATDARASKSVRIIGVFPANSHPPVTYPVARLKGSTNPEGERFRRFLLSGAGKNVFVRYGFSVR